MKHLSILFSTIIFLSSCAPKNKVLEDKIFFDLEQVINYQIEKLSSLKPRVSKIVRINEETEEIKNAEVDWVKELEVIKQSDLNKSAYALSYDILESENELFYSLKEGESLPVVNLRIVKDEKGEVASIHSAHAANNYLYNSEKTIEATFNEGLLHSYSVKGWQQLFIGKRKHFEINGEIFP